MFRVQIILLSCALIFVSLGLSEVSKDVGMVRFYKELGCKMKSAGSKDPVSYECPSQTQSTEKTCVIKGKTYQLGDDIKAEPGVCLAACKCLNPLRATRAKAVCANLECPEHFGVPVPKQCTRTYSLDQCCATGLLCDSAAAGPKDPNDKTKVIIKSPTTDFTCNVGGKQIDEHSKYYPDELPCSRCVCMKGHDGTNKAPWCTDMSCSIELRYNKELQDGCAPVFIKSSRCCPLQFRCPSKEDKVVPSSTTTVKKADSKAVNDAAKLGPQCSFGDLKLNIGDKLSSPSSDTGSDLECTCQIPPFVTCSKSTL